MVILVYKPIGVRGGGAGRAAAPPVVDFSGTEGKKFGQIGGEQKEGKGKKGRKEKEEKRKREKREEKERKKEGRGE